jgi:hypothetical protein
MCGADLGGGRFCTQAKLRERPRCKIHGGSTKVGPANPAFRHGRYSKHLPESLRVKYETALADPELLSVRDEIALVESRLSDVAQMIANGDQGPASWKAVKDNFLTLEKAMRRKTASPEEAAEAAAIIGETLAAMRAELFRATDQAEAWKELGKLVDLKTKVASREWKRLTDLRLFWTVEQGRQLLTGVIESIKRNVADPAVQQAIASDLARLFNR